ncbi:two-component system sensor histidine kinase NtrB [Thermodesulforhabdus norvegica]|uniref:histidine kinase n=1 Tax=Thermodesulforhabdus norvegica TaxID=39841 RepID=A0A1I4QYH0_9BACT|nr:ATP-binding protein [Thermodesulforhabdus norvegica]SFM45047.1 PAS domain S-box-containing protein [Thermodesulforhabdus norvegica]
MTLPLLPVWIVDFYGSVLMIVFAFLSVWQCHQLRRRDPNNVVWIYLLWFCYGLAGFAVSRSVGHILRRFLVSTHHADLWEALQPYSGAINTLMFVVVASITLFFERVWKIYQRMMAHQKALEDAHTQLLYLNRHLEEMVAERTRDLAISEQKFRRLFEVSRDMVVIVKPDGSIMDINPAGLKMIGWKESELASRRFYECFANPREWQTLKEELFSGTEIRDREYLLIKEGAVPVEVLVSAFCSRENDRELFYFWVKDISQRKNMEKKLLQADKLASLGQLAAGVAHEVNNPLGIILGYTQLLLRRSEPGDQFYEDLKTIEKHARNCKVIVEDLLKFARSAPTKKGPAHIHDAIYEVISVLKHQFSLDNVEFETHLDPQVPTMHWDINKMKQVFMNLFMNARQAMNNRGGLIRVETECKDGFLTVRVSDNGCGIPPEHLPRIFDPFFTTKPTGVGTGLGLSVSYGIIVEHGGTISVESEPEKGTTFTITFPVTEGNDGNGQKPAGNFDSGRRN